MHVAEPNDANAGGKDTLHMCMYHSSHAHHKIPKLFPITYRHVHENCPSVSSGHKSYSKVHAHTNKVHVKESPKHTRATSSKGNMIVLSPTPILVMNISIYINKRNTSVK